MLFLKAELFRLSQFSLERRRVQTRSPPGLIDLLFQVAILPWTKTGSDSIILFYPFIILKQSQFSLERRRVQTGQRNAFHARCAGSQFSLERRRVQTQITQKRPIEFSRVAILPWTKTGSDHWSHLWQIHLCKRVAILPWTKTGSDKRRTKRPAELSTKVAILPRTKTGSDKKSVSLAVA